jgi:hypothetical protein
MNCLTARQTLELARRDEPDNDGCVSGNLLWTTVEEASRHVEGCPTCQAAVRRQRQFDDKVGVMIREAPVPADLKDRLLARLEAEARMQSDDRGARTASPAADSLDVRPAAAVTKAGAATSSTAARPQVGSRRRWLGAAALAAACLLAGVGTWALWPVRPMVSPREVAETLATNIDPEGMAEFTQFSDGLVLKVPTTMKSSRLVHPPRHLGELDVAVYFLPLSGRRGAPLDGRLVVIPIRRVVANEIPVTDSFLAPPAPPIYTAGGFCYTVWVEGDFVYICCVKGGENELRRLILDRANPV